ncbi:MAG: glycoside hydrolase family 71/99-like protein, partial [Verrucomicrobiota bacterium]
NFEPGSCSIDLWPDLTEFDADERFPTPFRHADGRVAEVFSSLHPKTVNRHFTWMARYEIDGAFVQRFATHAKLRRDQRRLKYENVKLMLCRDAAMAQDRSWALMYDLSGLSDEDFIQVNEDWKQLRRRMQLGTDPGDSSYLHLRGKPLVAVWGVGFRGEDRKYSLERTEQFLRLLTQNPEWGGMSLMLGVPYYWLEQKGDATDDERLHEVLQLADVISPWSVGRYRSVEEAKDKALLFDRQRADREWCERRQIHYLPVLFPGFRWMNLYGAEEAGSAIPRIGGRFLWQQFQVTASAGNRSAYLAMFDEMDEGTALFKCTNDPPIGASTFGTYEGLPTDHYLWLCKEGGRLLRGEVPQR